MASGKEASLWQRLVAAWSPAAPAAPPDVPLPMVKLACERRPGAEPRPPVVLLGCGSFNPPTVAHLRIFELARDHLAQAGYDVLGGYMSPVNDAYHKAGLAPARHRVAMAQAAAETSPLVMVDAWEAAQPGYQRSLTVLQRLQRELRDAFAGAASDQQPPVRVMLLCGADLVESFASPGVWKPEHLQAILHDHGVVCISRGSAAVAEGLPPDLRESVTFVEEPVANGISSTAVRQLLAEGRSVRYLTPDAVISYIRENGLYAPDSGKTAQQP